MREDLQNFLNFLDRLHDEMYIAIVNVYNSELDPTTPISRKAYERIAAKHQEVSHRCQELIARDANLDTTELVDLQLAHAEPFDLMAADGNSLTVNLDGFLKFLG